MRGHHGWDELGVRSFDGLYAPLLIDDDPLLNAVAKGRLATEMLSGLRSAGLRGLVRETDLRAGQLVLPLFVSAGSVARDNGGADACEQQWLIANILGRVVIAIDDNRPVESTMLLTQAV